MTVDGEAYCWEINFRDELGVGLDQNAGLPMCTVVAAGSNQALSLPTPSEAARDVRRMPGLGPAVIIIR